MTRVAIGELSAEHLGKLIECDGLTIRILSIQHFRTGTRLRGTVIGGNEGWIDLGRCSPHMTVRLDSPEPNGLKTMGGSEK